MQLREDLTGKTGGIQQPSGRTVRIGTDSREHDGPLDLRAGRGYRSEHAGPGQYRLPAENVKQQMPVTDGAVAGTTFKKDGTSENRVDGSRVKRFMDKARSFRA